LSPLLSLLLTHDHFFSKGGIAASSGHALRQSIERHKARLQAEFTKARLRRQCATVEALKQNLKDEKDAHGLRAREPPRWVRINRLKAVGENALESALGGYRAVATLSEVLQAGPKSTVFWRDCNIPDLLALPPGTSLIKTKAYAEGELILQDKASCFPAQLLLGASGMAPRESGLVSHRDIMDACAAPGNKTTHLAAILAASATRVEKATKSEIYACERDPSRSKLLQTMVSKAGAAKVVVLPRQDFLALDGSDIRFAHVTHLLLDPSCSGSGIVGREDIPVLALPTPPSRGKPQKQNLTNGKKRKRGPEETPAESINDPGTVEDEEYTHLKIDNTRLEKLSNLQSRIIEHAFTFPAATRITYSTCSIHAEENENVVARVLQSHIALRRGWRLLLRRHQVEGLREWKHRGLKQPSTALVNAVKTLTDDELDGCIRCDPGDEEGTMGFFVCCFVRDGSELKGVEAVNEGPSGDGGADIVVGDDPNDTWSGFED